MSGIFRPRQSVGRVCANAGNRGFIAGGVGANRSVLHGAPADPDPGDLAKAEPVPMLDHDAAAARKVGKVVRVKRGTIE
jgi:hypothetical protein